MLHTLLFSLQNAVYFVMLLFFGSYVINILHTGCQKVKADGYTTQFPFRTTQVWPPSIKTHLIPDIENIIKLFLYKKVI
jgi:hypothetical protein